MSASALPGESEASDGSAAHRAGRPRGGECCGWRYGEMPSGGCCAVGLVDVDASERAQIRKGVLGTAATMHNAAG